MLAQPHGVARSCRCRSKGEADGNREQPPRGAQPNNIALQAPACGFLPMKRVAYLSRMLRSVGCEVVTTALEIELADGMVHRYFGLPKRRYQNLLAAGPPDACLERQTMKVYRSAKST